MGNQQSLETGQSVRIANLTEIPLVYVISQVGPLYWGVIQPGERVTRCTGRVWFTVQCYPYNGKNEPQTGDAVVATLFPTLIGLAVVVSGGLAFAGAAAAAAPLAGTAQATLASLLPLSEAPLVVGAMAGGAAASTTYKVGQTVYSIVKKEELEHSLKPARKTGHYANGDWIHVHGGPKKDVPSYQWEPLHFVA
ncbi:hypothetical protein KCU98_g3019, partial [Aureobasidium melanogenum]